MPRVRDVQLYDEMLEAIKTLARAQMSQEGTSSLSLRGIARDLGVTAPALYRYFPSRDDLITALIVDGFTALAHTLEAADANHDCADYRGRFADICRAYRRFALERSVDFQLIYGNPIPGYVAPKEVTVPTVIQVFTVFSIVFIEAFNAGKLKPLPQDRLQPTVVAGLEQIITRNQVPTDVPVMYGVFAAWTKIHGVVMLELFHHLEQTVGDTALFFENELALLIDQLGFL
ncbi:MAG: TetR/AcrR family transcriptional regulator [Pleurocapsa minor GSE-CHR-MK-17-07R]|jgi:AcrR family transcriptional regulator|nr:TetR/AcrR family transcriptional regulator [Pleurocapsa minor GSE-CHR-MK 17-07R]